MSSREIFIEKYVDELRGIMVDRDPAVVMDAVNDAREYLYAETETIFGSSDVSEEAAVARAADKFGTPEEVARAFLEVEEHIKRAFAVPEPKPQKGILSRFFGITSDIRAYQSMFYMILSFFTGIICFVWVVYMVPISLVALIFIVGIPVVLLFFASIRGLVMLDSRMIELLLGERMPRRPVFVRIQGNLLAKFMGTVRDRYTWTTFIYVTLLAPLGFLYALFILISLAFTVEMLIVPIVPQFTDAAVMLFQYTDLRPGLWALPITTAIAFVMFTLILHAARFVGRTHARMAKHLLVKVPSSRVVRSGTELP